MAERQAAKEEVLFQDALDHLQMEASRDGNIERAVAMMVRRFFLLGKVDPWVDWAMSTSGEPSSFRGDATRLATFMSAQRWGKPRHHGSFAVRIGEGCDGSWAIEFGMPNRESDGALPPACPRLMIGLPAPLSDDTRQRAEFFRNYVRGHQTVYQTARALKSASVVGRWESRFREISSGSELGLADRLRQALALLDELAASPWSREARGLAARVARWAVHEQLGTGWGVKRLIGPESTLVRERFCEKLRQISAAARRKQDLAEEDGVRWLTTFADMIHGPPSNLGDAHWATGLEAPYETLRRWSWLQEVARRQLRRGDIADDDPDETLWDRVAESSRSGLASLTAKFWNDGQLEAGERGVDVARLRSFLQLWLCLGLLRDVQPSQLPDILRSERWELRADLAYVIREALRFMLMGADAEYRFQPAALAAALRTIVSCHCHRVLQIPADLDVRSHLNAVAETTGSAGYHFAMGHLQHVLDVYVVGQFLGALTIPGVGAGEPTAARWTMAHVLASRPGLQPAEHSRRELLAAFAVAALFHDVGMMLLVPRQHLPDYVFRNDAPLRERIRSLSSWSMETASEVIECCLSSLRSIDCLPRKEGSMQHWLDHQSKVGVPEHALLGAWYLQRIGAKASLFSPEILRAAVRAVLLHAATDYAVDSRKDPVAALLIFCDEVFEWAPTERVAPAASAVSRTPYAMAVDVAPHVSRVSRIALRDVVVAADGSQLDCSVSSPGGCWPRVDIYLRHPEFLDVPVYRTWLVTAGNLGRLSRTDDGWCPNFGIISAVPDRAVQTRHTLMRAMRRTKLPIRPTLERWLADKQRFNGLGPTDSRDYVNLSAGVDLVGIGFVVTQLCDEIYQLTRDDID